MKSIFLFSFLVLSSLFGKSQDLSFSELGSEPAYCRLFGYQNGNGLVYAGAIGGAGSYTYLWEEIATGATNTTTTWGARNPGYYSITVTDDAGNTLTETIFLDSVNVKADFYAYSDALTETPDGYLIGFAPDTIGFVNTSLYVNNPNNPHEDTTFAWQFNNPDEGLLIVHSFNTQYKDYLYGGEFEICLTAWNKNGCFDKTCKIMGLFGSFIEVSENEILSEPLSIVTNKKNNQIIISNVAIEQKPILKIHSLTGQLILTQNLNSTVNSVPFEQETGIYLYSIFTENGEIIESGKFNY